MNYLKIIVVTLFIVFVSISVWEKTQSYTVGYEYANRILTEQIFAVYEQCGSETVVERHEEKNIVRFGCNKGEHGYWLSASK